MNHAETAARAYLRRILGFPEKEIDEIVSLGRVALARAVDDLQRALAGDDPIPLADAAHAVKGMLRNLGLEELAGLARQVEEQAVGGSQTGAREAVAALRRELAPFCGPASSGEASIRTMDSAALKA
jgi:HPt (histidine-containing phosphotransfer) domain-containing protein